LFILILKFARVRAPNVITIKHCPSYTAVLSYIKTDVQKSMRGNYRKVTNDMKHDISFPPKKTFSQAK